MKSVGKQLEEARLAKNWTPELAARETKIKVDRLRDLEVDDYSQFSSPTYARGFVRTYARALGLDEYKILRQLDNKLPEDDNASFANESGLPYVPEPSQSMHVSSANRTGLYIVLGLGCAVTLIIAFVLLQAYRIGELPRYFAAASADTSTNAVPTNAAPVVDAEAPAAALPVDPVDTSHSKRALPVDLNALTTTDTSTNAPAVAATTNAVPVVPVATATAPATNTPPAANPPAPVVAKVDASGPLIPPAPVSTPSTNAAPVVAAATPPAAVPMVDPTAPVPPVATPAPADAPAPEAPVRTSSSARASDTGLVDTSTHVSPRALPVDPADLAADPSAPVPTAAATPTSPSPGDASPTQLDLSPAPAPGTAPSPAPAPAAPDNSPSTSASPEKSLVLAASRDSFLRVTLLDVPEGQGVLYASVLRQGQSMAFSGHKFSVNVGIPSAIDITLDGVNYGPHSTGDSPETFTLESHQP
jgi:cytoskeleton protein RodZ